MVFLVALSRFMRAITSKVDSIRRQSILVIIVLMGKQWTTPGQMTQSLFGIPWKLVGFDLALAIATPSKRSFGPMDPLR